MAVLPFSCRKNNPSVSLITLKYTMIMKLTPEKSSQDKTFTGELYKDLPQPLRMIK